jgi:hypothetical protein
LAHWLAKVQLGQHNAIPDDVKIDSHLLSDQEICYRTKKSIDALFCIVLHFSADA